MERRVKVLAAVATCAAALAATAAPAQAYDAYPCGPERRHSGGWMIQYCPLWTGNVPVHREPFQSSPIVGRLHQGGSANWFYAGTGCIKGRYWLGSYTNHWWAYTMSDTRNAQGRLISGWVNQVYFSGGGNDEPDRGLRWYGGGWWDCLHVPAPTPPAR